MISWSLDLLIQHSSKQFDLFAFQIEHNDSNIGSEHAINWALDLINPEECVVQGGLEQRKPEVDNFPLPNISTKDSIICHPQLMWIQK